MIMIFRYILRGLQILVLLKNYFLEVILAWEANLDVLSVFKNYKAVTCMCTYLSKSEDECTQAMSQAACIWERLG